MRETKAQIHYLSGEEERFLVGDVTVLLGVLFLDAGLNVALA